MASLDFRALLKQEKIKHRATLAVERDNAAESHPTRDGGNHRSQHGNLQSAPFRSAGNISTIHSTNKSSSSLRGVVNGPILDMVNIRLGATRSIFYAPDFVSESQAQHILSRVYDTKSDKGGVVQAGDSAWLVLTSRRLQCWGGQPGEDFRQDPLPIWMENLCDALVARGAFPSEGRPNHVLINDDYVLGTGEGVRAIHSQCVELAETQPDAVHESMVGAARAVAMRYCSHGDRPPQALQGNSRAAWLASLKHGHPGLCGVHQAEIIAGLDPDLILEKHGTQSCRKFRNEVCFAAAKALNFKGKTFRRSVRKVSHMLLALCTREMRSLTGGSKLC